MAKRVAKLSSGFFRQSHAPDVEIESDEEPDRNARNGDIEVDDAPPEKKLQMAKEYIKKIKAQMEDNDDLDDQILMDKQEQEGRLFRALAEGLEARLKECKIDVKLAKNGHRKAPTCVCLSPNTPHVYTGGKDGSLFKWSIQPIHQMKRVASAISLRKKITGVEGHDCPILALAVHSAGTTVCSGDEKGKIILWNNELKYVHKFIEHKKSITGLTFRRNAHELFSCSVDKTVKVWDIESRTYIETLFGHQDTVHAIDANTRERAITAGGRDNTIRIFKIPEETQLVYRGHQGSIDCVALLNDVYFVSGGDDGAINFWSTKRKKPICVMRNAHAGTWVTALGAIINSDVFVSGGCDGYVRIWKMMEDRTRIEQLSKIQLEGVINAVRISPDAKTIVAAVGQENRLGRWHIRKTAKNAIAVIKLDGSTDDESSSSDEESETEEELGSE